MRRNGLSLCVVASALTDAVRLLPWTKSSSIEATYLEDSSRVDTAARRHRRLRAHQKAKDLQAG